MVVLISVREVRVVEETVTLALVITSDELLTVSLKKSVLTR
jgi:hypothetical protein